MIKDRVVVATDGSATYVTIDGDMVDAVAYAFFGSRHEGNTEAVLSANPGLAELGPILPAGVVIKLPRKATAPAAKPYRQLWS